MMSAVTYLTLGALLARSHERKLLKAYSSAGRAADVRHRRDPRVPGRARARGSVLGLI